MTKKSLLILAFFAVFFSAFAQKKQPDFTDVVSAPNPWADSILSTLSTREKIGQLFMPAAYSNKNGAHIAEISKLIAEQKVGGLCFFQGSAQKQVELTNYYQRLADVPLLLSMDAEWGVGMRLDSVTNFPFQIAMGATADDSLVYRVGAEVARQFKLLGMHVNFAPVADVNSNPLNPVINARSFGEDKESVTRKCLAYTRGMQDNGILACAKHFPGHGNTETDTHHAIAKLSMGLDTFYNVDLYPFKKLVDGKVAGVMVSHLSVPALDTSGEIATLSPRLNDSILHKYLNFNGLTFTDGMQMRAVTNHYQSAQANLHALLAGNDMLVFPINIVESIDTIEQAINSGIFSMEMLNEKCLRVLKAKHYVGLSKRKIVKQRDWSKALNPRSAQLLRTQIIENAVTLTKNDKDFLPLKRLDTLKIAYLEVAKSNAGNEFYNTAQLYANVDFFRVDQTKPFTYDSLNVLLKDCNTLIVGYLDIEQRRPNIGFGMDSAFCKWLTQLAATKNTVLVQFANPYTLARLGTLAPFKSVLIAYNGGDDYQKVSAEAIFGGLAFKGKSPVMVPDLVALGQGVETQQTRLKYGSPEELGLKPEMLKSVDSLVQQAIDMKAFPGCQVLAVHKGVVFYQKSFGYHTYEHKTPVRNSDLYDMASVTKVTATLPVFMQLLDNQDVKLNDNLGKHVKFKLGKKSNKYKLSLRNLLLHQSGLKAWMPLHVEFMQPVFPHEMLLSATQNEAHPFKLYAKTYLNKFHTLDTAMFSTAFSPKFSNPVAAGIFASNAVKVKAFRLMDETELQSKTYRYSDLGFYYLQRVAENKLGARLDTLSNDFIYKKLGMTRTTFLPLQKFELTQIVPTEHEYPFRHQLIHGYVHDHGAAIIGGVAGHAGVFSTANDMAKIMQMYLWRGRYGGEQLINRKTVDEFTAYHDLKKGNRRGYGFDKPEPNPKKGNPVCAEASADSYGHSGFTGTFVWVDPQRDLVYIFLSNRVHPDYNNNLISTTNVRTNILREFLLAIDRAKK
ncbi:MAG: serine hydrolase [Prevotellaceae bacterium]|jgi:beta-glucosidase-like glycosyl hydrolase/CubicO group peptidase (beta-lactamase class C family)|nr:serine hydrolase [Prevotellaceae bacterium]